MTSSVAKVTFRQGMSFEGVTPTGHSVVMDSATEFGGEDQGARPIELLLVGLGGCTGMDVVSILRKMRQQFTAYEVVVHATRAETHPRIYTDIHVEHVITGKDLSEEAVKRAVELSETRYCSISAMLGKAAPLTHTYRIVEAEEV